MSCKPSKHGDFVSLIGLFRWLGNITWPISLYTWLWLYMGENSAIGIIHVCWAWTKPLALVERLCHMTASPRRSVAAEPSVVAILEPASTDIPVNSETSPMGSQIAPPNVASKKTVSFGRGSFTPLCRSLDSEEKDEEEGTELTGSSLKAREKMAEQTEWDGKQKRLEKKNRYKSLVARRRHRCQLKVMNPLGVVNARQNFFFASCI